MAQMVPCSSSDYGLGDDVHYDSQVPSPTLSYTTSYWCESNRSPALYHAHSPPPPAPVQQQQHQQSLLSLCFDSSAASLEELLNEYSYYDVTKEPLKEQLKKQPALPVAAAAPAAASATEEHVLLRQCLQHTPSDLDLVDQLGSAIVFPDLNTFSGFTMKSEKVNDCYWSSSDGSSSSAASGGSSSSSAGLASVLNLVMEQINEEIRSTCQILGLSPSKLTISSRIQIRFVKRVEVFAFILNWRQVCGSVGLISLILPSFFFFVFFFVKSVPLRTLSLTSCFIVFIPRFQTRNQNKNTRTKKTKLSFVGRWRFWPRSQVASGHQFHIMPRLLLFKILHIYIYIYKGKKI